MAGNLYRNMNGVFCELPISEDEYNEMVKRNATIPEMQGRIGILLIQLHKAENKIATMEQKVKTAVEVLTAN